LMNLILLVLRVLLSGFLPPAQGLGRLAVGRDGRVRCLTRQDDPWEQLREAWSRLTNFLGNRQRGRRPAGAARTPCALTRLLRGLD
jgi:hypothetical protein